MSIFLRLGWSLSLLLWAAPPENPFARGVAAYREGRFDLALRAFEEAESLAGGRASPELLYDKGLAALACSDLAQAKAAAEGAAMRDRERFGALSEFLLGNIAYEAARRAANLAEMPEAEPFAFDVAIAHAEEAKTHWRAAALSRDDWAAARRNLERGSRLLTELKKKRDEALARRNEPDRGAPPTPLPIGKNREEPAEPQPPGEWEETDEPASLEPTLEELPKAEVVRLFERLMERERTKQKLRWRERSERRSDVEKDW